MLNSTPDRLLRVLLIEDNEDDVLLLERHLRGIGYQPQVCQVNDLIELRAALMREEWDVVISDYHLPGFTAMLALDMLQELDCDLPFIVVSGVIEEESACQIMLAGAQDFMSKSKLDRLAPVIERERREACMRRERRAALDGMRVSDARFHALAANVPGVLFQMQADQMGLLQFLYVSEASHMLLGLSAEELRARPDPLLELIVADDREDFLAALNSASERNATLNWEGRILPQGAEEKWINLRCSPRQIENGTTLWEGVMWNITQSKHNEIELRQSRKQLAELSNHLQHAKEEERERIARDIHDVLGGTLVGIKIAVSLLAGKLDHELALKERVRGIEQMLDDAITTTGRVARELRPGILKEFGLAAAVESYAEDFEHRTGLRCAVLCADHDIETCDDTSLAMFRTFQEALTNVSKHAQAGLVEVRLMQEGDEIVLEVADDGRGVKVADLNKPKSFGLRGIRERLHALGGTMQIRPRADCGTLVVLRAPLRDDSIEVSRDGAAIPNGQALA
ncbi:hybrid sensor histidine kinase/response regulator [Uliginosibacterium sp. H1]|uniref:hybrid sensor histidine kinase/response regulator n=1 Tax=Uliginosibacterium sp. H1 TaxID=3114757 RepID=UPI002E188720|nr:histidine kinase [Uliginosibacterium sp. H1]